MKRVYNFNAGPAAVPLAALEKAKSELLDFNFSGMSVMELSHRSKEYEGVHNNAINLLKELYGIGDDYEVLLLQGGASLQFAMIPMNFLTPGKKAAYVMTGAWSEKAYAEGKMIGEVVEAASSKASNYSEIPSLDSLKYAADSAYLHITSNNTIFGTQWHTFPETETTPLIADMSSDILCKPIDINKFSLIYAGAQKNLGPAGVSTVIIKKSFRETAKADLPAILRYSVYAKDNSLYNTPPTFGIYMMGLVLENVKAEGGLESVYKNNLKKAGLIYDTIDKSGGFYQGHAKTGSRSIMNVTFRLKNEDIEKKFLDQAKAADLVGLNGHRSVGGCRASRYNAVTYEACEVLADLMVKFQKENS